LHIKEIEIKNFKSFGRKVSIPLENDFIAITGPNGSGKSNIVDALLFALCLSSSRVMRAERLPDLIYKGENGKNPDFAQVTVRFDNSCHTMPVDEDVVEISRKVKLTKDRYHSVYYFNGDICSQSELHDILSRSGITPEGYNVVMQGDVTRIIEMNPSERRKIIDEIAGVADFDEKKRKALGELEVVRERIDRLDVILDEVSAQRLKLGEERDRALTYQAHRDEKRHQEAFLLLAKLREAEAEQASLEKETEDLVSQNELFRERYRAKKDALASLEDELKRLSSDIAHKGEDEQLKVKRKIEELKGEIEREESRIEMADREISETEVERRRIYLEMDRLSEEAEALATKIRDAGIREASLIAELEEERERLEAVLSEIAEADVEYAQLRDEMAVVKRKREEVKTEMADLMRDRDRYLDAARRRSGDQEDICSQISEYEETIRRSEREAERIERELDLLEERGRELKRNDDDLGFAMIGVRRELAEADQRLQELQVEKAKAEASLRSAREGPGYSRGVEVVRSALQKGQLEGLHGTIAELGRADNSYATALEVAAGARLQSIVAQTDEDASQAISYLKRVRGGRVTFLPLNKMKTGRVPLDPPSFPGVVDYALNLVQFDGEFLPAFWHVFRDTLVVEDLTSARQLMGRYRMVTLEGDLVEKSGAMTGGHYRSRVSFAADEGKRLAEISGRLALAEEERGGILDRLDRVEGEISRLKRDEDELNRELSKKSFRLEETKGQTARLEKTILEQKARLADMEQEAAGVRERLDSLETVLEKHKKTLTELDSKIETLEKGLEGSEIPVLTSRAEEAEARIRDLERRKGVIDAEITKDKLKEEIGTQRIDELAARKAILEDKKKDALDRKRSAGEQRDENKKVMEAKREREKEIEKELHDLKGVRGMLLEDVMARQREVDSLQMESERIKARMTATSVAGDEAKARAEEIRAEIVDRGVDATAEPPKVQTIMRKIKALERSMLELEPVNMLAIEEYGQVSDRCDFLLDRRDTLQREREDILDKLDRYDLMKKEAFMISFNAINENFKSIFNQLSGGEGGLILEDEEDPLGGGMTIRARPARKSFHRLEAMSGGEKSLTALAFIFAIQRFKPAPFYALDEIDMFLDGANVEKVAKLINDISEVAQFMVVSLRKPMIQEARYILGVTIQENNISSVTGLSLN